MNKFEQNKADIEKMLEALNQMDKACETARTELRGVINASINNKEV